MNNSGNSTRKNKWNYRCHMRILTVYALHRWTYTEEFACVNTLINPDISLDDERATQMKLLYSNCPSEMKESLLHHTQETAKELTELSRKLESF